MIEYSGKNPYRNFSLGNRLLLSAVEVPGSVRRLHETLKQRNNEDVRAQDWMNQAVSIGRENLLHDVFPPDNETVNISRRISSGFNTSVYSFDTTSGSWVLKIGSPKSAVPGWFDPSSLEYAQWYALNLGTLQQTFKDALPHVIPKPQYVLYAKNGLEQTSLVIQPYIPVVGNPLLALDYPRDVRESIGGELVQFYSLCERTRKTHGVFPDFGREGNLVFTGGSGEPHIVFLDNGLVDQNSPSPVMNRYNLIRYHKKMRSTIREFRKSLN